MPNGHVPKLLKQVAFIEPTADENSKTVFCCRAGVVVLVLAVAALVWAI